MSTDSAAGEELVELEGSHRNRLDITGTLVDAPADDVVTVTVVLRRRNELPEEIVHGQERVSREEFASRYGADPADIEGMQEFAQSRDLVRPGKSGGCYVCEPSLSLPDTNAL